MAGELHLQVDGSLSLQSGGETTLSDGGGDTCCCDGTLYRRYKSCATNSYVNLWEAVVDPVADPTYYPKYIVHVASPALGCLYIDAGHETTTSPSRVLGAENVDYFVQREGYECDCTVGACFNCDDGPPDTNPFAVVLQFHFPSPVCCSHIDPDVPSNSYAVKYEINATINMICYLEPGQGACIWFGSATNVGTISVYSNNGLGATDCGGTPDTGYPFPLDMAANTGVLADPGEWGVAATMNLQGQTGDGETRTVFFGGCTVAAYDCSTGCVATNDITAVCGDATDLFAAGGTCTIIPVVP